MTQTLNRLCTKVANGLMVRTHSAEVLPGEVFVALPGTVHDGTRFITQALDRGAGFVVAGRPVELPSGSRAELVVCRDPAEALGELARAYFKTGELRFPVVGVTGTNGKTTVCAMVEHLFVARGRKVGVIGTISRRWPGHLEQSSMTTPGCWELHSLLSEMAAAGVEAACMEVSSHALQQNRIAGIDLAVGVFTNLTQDHLDYHGDMESYFRAKSLLFGPEGRGSMTGVVNTDDAFGRRLAGSYSPVIGFGLEPFSEGGLTTLSGEITRCDSSGISLRMRFQGREWDLATPLVGRHNASNLLAAQAVGLGLGLRVEELGNLQSFPGVSGRLERVGTATDLDIFVDYAHTPDALENVLTALRQTGFSRVITVFGCGGDRDPGKRPLMGKAVGALSDIAVLTSDNPRHEDPEAIMDQVMPGLNGCPKVIREPDRREAIRLAIDAMRPGDALLIAGKGHETTQQIGDEKIPFSDQQTVRELTA